MKLYLMTTKAEKLKSGIGHTSAYRMAVNANGKVEAKKKFKEMTGYAGKVFARQIGVCK